MKLIKDIIINRINISKDFELNNEYFKSFWNFYQVYQLCINILGVKYSKMNEKNKLLKLLIINPNDIDVINKLKSHIYKDNKIIEIVLNNLEDKEEEIDVYDDFYPVNIVGVNIYERF